MRRLNLDALASTTNILALGASGREAILIARRLLLVCESTLLHQLLNDQRRSAARFRDVDLSCRWRRRCVVLWRSPELSPGQAYSRLYPCGAVPRK